jgi:hypothetical protein
MRGFFMAMDGRYAGNAGAISGNGQDGRYAGNAGAISGNAMDGRYAGNAGAISGDMPAMQEHSDRCAKPAIGDHE